VHFPPTHVELTSHQPVWHVEPQPSSAPQSEQLGTQPLLEEAAVPLDDVETVLELVAPPPAPLLAAVVAVVTTLELALDTAPPAPPPPTSPPPPLPHARGNNKSRNATRA